MPFWLSFLLGVVPLDDEDAIVEVGSARGEVVEAVTVFRPNEPSNPLDLRTGASFNVATAVGAGVGAEREEGERMGEGSSRGCCAVFAVE